MVAIVFALVWLSSFTSEAFRSRSNSSRAAEETSTVGLSASGNLKAVKELLTSDIGGTAPKVKSCRAGVHTYINFGDGGCFQHLDSSGAFKDSTAKTAYKKKFCPFVLPSGDSKRMALMKWYDLSIDSGSPPFAVNDLAMTCLLGDVDTVASRYGGNGEDSLANEQWSGEDFCETMLSLPLMFEAIGFDGPGLLMEDSRTSTKWTFKGKETTVLEDTRAGPSYGCSSTMSSRTLGPTWHGRLALRAVLPSYFLHRYAQSGKGMVVKGVRALLRPGTRFKSSYWTDPVEKVCEAASSPEKLEELYSFANLKAGKLISQNVMKRDAGRCGDATPCNYATDTIGHLGACDVCNNKKYPWFDEGGGECWNSQGLERKKCEGSSGKKRTCKCHKAICWYFTRDVGAAMRAATTACKHVE